MAKAKLTAVTLSCIYSGYEGNPGPGTTIEIDADEAARLIEIGAAVAATAVPTADEPAAE